MTSWFAKRRPAPSILQKDPARRAGGKRAQSIGKQFEYHFDRLAPYEGINLIDIPDGCRVVGKGVLIREPTPFDAVLVNRRKEGRDTAFVDFKTISGDRFSYSAIHDKPHQLENLETLAARSQLAGFIVWFRAEGTAMAGLSGPIVFFPIATLLAVQERQSLHSSQGLAMGSFAEPAFHRLFTAI